MSITGKVISITGGVIQIIATMMSIDIIQRETVIIMDPRRDGETIITIGISILTIVNGRKESHCVKDVSELGCGEHKWC
jgi:hypothetical protein